MYSNINQEKSIIYISHMSEYNKLRYVDNIINNIN